MPGALRSSYLHTLNRAVQLPPRETRTPSDPLGALSSSSGFCYTTRSLSPVSDPASASKRGPNSVSSPIPTTCSSHKAAAQAVERSSWQDSAVASHLTSMKLEPAFSLPPPTSLPQLTILHLAMWPASRTQTMDDCLSNCGPLLPQLTEVSVKAVEGYMDGSMWPQWHLLFNPASTTNTLTTFITDEYLSDELLELLLEHAPALQSLAVYQLDLEYDYRDEVWGVQALHLLTEFVNHDSSELQWLPTCSSGSVLVRMHHALDFTVDSTEGISAGFCDRLGEWKFDAHAVHLHPAAILPVADQPAALRAALGQLCVGLQVVRRRDYYEARHTSLAWDELPSIGAVEDEWTRPLDEWQAHTPLLDVSEWAATPDMVRTCAPYIHQFDEPELPKVDQLTDELLSAALDVAPQLRTLTAGALTLQSDQHASAAWPWDKVSVRTVDVTQLLRLPHPGVGGAGGADGGAGGASGGADGGNTGAACMGGEGMVGDGRAHGGGAQGETGTLPVVKSAEIIVPETITKVQAEALCARLGYIQWGKLYSFDLKGVGLLRISLRCPADSDTQLAVVSVQTDLLHALRFAPHFGPPIIDLAGWPMREGVMRALSGLPHWPAWLDFSKSKWPLQPTEYKALAQHVPTSYTVWMLPGQPGSPFIQSIIAGVLEAGVKQSKIALVLPEYTGAPVKRGEHVLMVKGGSMHALSTWGVEECWENPTRLS